MHALKLAEMVPEFLEMVFRAMDDVQRATPENSHEFVDGLFKLYIIIRPYKAFFKQEIIGDAAYNQMQKFESLMVQTEALQLANPKMNLLHLNHKTPSPEIPKRERNIL